jgi:hypothetical protein
VIEAPFLDTPKRIEALFLATLSRLPSDEETATMQEHVDKASPGVERKQAFADIFWVLLNSTEFALNH